MTGAVGVWQNQITWAPWVIRLSYTAVSLPNPLQWVSSLLFVKACVHAHTFLKPPDDTVLQGKMKTEYAHKYVTSASSYFFKSAIFN